MNKMKELKTPETFKKTRAINQRIIVRMIDDKPYYSIRYFNLDDCRFHVGYGSYKLEFVVEWLRECFDIMENFGWIPVSERLPKPQDLHEISLEDCTEYLIQRRYCVMNIAKYIKIYGKAFFCTHGFEVNDVIAWQPLPEPYHGGRKE